MSDTRNEGSEDPAEGGGDAARARLLSPAWHDQQRDRVLGALATNTSAPAKAPSALTTERARIQAIVRRILPFAPMGTLATAASSASGFNPNAAEQGAGGPPSDQTPSPRDRSWRNQFLGLLSLAITAILVIAAAAPVLGLIYSLRPDWRPEGPPPVRAATIEHAALEEREIICPGTRNQECVRIGYVVEFQGFQRDQVGVAWAAFNPATLSRVDLDVTGAPPPGMDMIASYAIAEAASDRASHSIDVPIPREGQCIFVRISIVDLEADNTGLALASSREGTPPKGSAGHSAAGTLSAITPTPAPWPTRLDVADTPPFHTHDQAVPCDGTGATDAPA